MSVIQWFRTKTGIDVGNFAELISQESDKIADQRRSEPKGLDLSRLPVLENELFQLQFRIQDCHECLQVMEPELTRVADQLRQKLEGLADLEKQIRELGLHRHVGEHLQAFKRTIETLEYEHAELRRRVEGKQRVLTATEDLLKEWHRQHDDELAKLRRADKILSGREGGFIHSREGSRGMQPQDARELAAGLASH